MLPATLALEVKKQVLHYLGATFHIRHQETERALEAFFTHPDEGLFKGPWLQLKRPFRLEKADTSSLFDLHVPWVPFKHQAQSWQRLTTRGGNSPEPTIVTTGTGSGKTECFLYPLLDHCLRMKQAGKDQGIKAIVLYPMNALAADQANRFAEEILTSDQLSYDHNGERKARIRVGMYTGRMTQTSSKDDGAEKDTFQEMTIIPDPAGGGKIAYRSITNRAAMQENPPDILLTNYKMLDYLLLRPKDTSIWRFNQDDPELLQYLVLDELHTYDGAQGADVACLIRRLKERFQVPQGKLCMVGTSATVAGGDDEHDMGPIYKLCEFASTLFEEDITHEAVIKEDRYRIEEVVRTPVRDVETYPSAEDCAPAHREDAQSYARRVAELFGGPAYPVAIDDPKWSEWSTQHEQLESFLPKLKPEDLWGVAVGEWIRKHPLFHLLLKVTEAGAVSWFDLLREISKSDMTFTFRAVGDTQARGEVLMAFLALVARARELRSGKPFPLVPTQVQLWLRELRRIGSLVSQHPMFTWLDNKLQEGKRQLPIVHCTECGEVAWVGLRDPDMDSVIGQHGINGMQLRDDVREIYEAWGFERAPSPSLVILSPWRDGDDPISASGQQQLDAVKWHLAASSLVVREGPGPCPITDEKTFPVKMVHESYSLENGARRGTRRCPHCHENESLMFIGSRAATISSVAIDEVFGSVLNNDPKLLAFTDSVQDASHRAGFFSARTYHFTLRTALQHVIDEAGDEGVPLPEVGQRLIDYWGADRPGRPGTAKQALETLIPTDLREYDDYVDFRNRLDAREIPPKLLGDITRRLTWEATSEFSLMLTHGRTMELHASATLGWVPELVDETVSQLKARLPAISPKLEAVSPEDITLWVLGILHRQRERGGLYHPYLGSYAAQRFWGKYPFGKTIAGRETYPPQGKYKPRLMCTQPNKDHDHILAPAKPHQMLPWHLKWARKVMELPGIDDATLVDLVQAFLKTGESTGLLREVHADGEQHFYAINDQAARLYPSGEKLIAPNRGYKLFRPEWEARLWTGAASLAYLDDEGYYEPGELTDREGYYRTRYRKGALRRVFAHEHTGLLATAEREALEYSFNKGSHADDPNVLTATSTLEMGIDIGDLSTTMLCSIPPTTASYLQRIGRAGRKTGTALVLSVINQRPHDLFFYSRPDALISGDIEPPGCWLDASAVLVRQYLAFCFDQGVREGILADLPATGKQLIDEIIETKSGHIPELLTWVLENEQTLQTRFLERFKSNAKGDTQQRFLAESRTERLRERIEKAAAEFRQQRLLLENAKRRLRAQKEKLDGAVDNADLLEIEREERILNARQLKMNQISALEVLTEHGLLPNYAFPERGVRFSGAVFHRKPKGTAGDHELRVREPFELVRGGSAAIRELAPWNHFYTHSHRFDIQQIEIGSKSEPLITEWGVCGQCGHMRMTDDINRPEAVPACPQCGFDGIEGQTVKGQQANFLEFSRSQAISYMEFYDSLSGDKGDERENEVYQLVNSFDQTVEQASGAVANDKLPFGIEYRAAMVLREVNAGFKDQHRDLAFGNDVKVSSEGFVVCADCGVAVKPEETRDKVNHRRSCSGHRETQKRKREGRMEDAYRWEKVFLYRELRSEAIRLLLPDVEPEDLSTLEAAIYLGMRLRFQGDPGHLLVKQQIVPNLNDGTTQNYLVLMDAVPGGTGFLKELFQTRDDADRSGEGVMEVLRLALAELETCRCRELHQTEDDTDGCYRCLRTYHMQFRADEISRERGIRLLKKLIAAGMERETKAELDEVKPKAQFESVLEKRFVTKLQDWVQENGKPDDWREELIGGATGFRFTLGDGRLWSLQLQPKLGSPQGVAVQCQPDFLLTADDEVCRPVAIFLDGFEPHVKPTEPNSGLADDLRKRRSVLQSQGYWVWSISWDDLNEENGERFRYLDKQVTDVILPKRIDDIGGKAALRSISGHAFSQFKAFLRVPNDDTWRKVGQETLGFTLMLMAGQGIGQDARETSEKLQMWRQGYPVPAPGKVDNPEWTWIAQNLSISNDLFAYGLSEQLIQSDYTNLYSELRLGDSEAERSGTETFKLRWRRFHALMNLFQFMGNVMFYTTSEVEDGVIPEPTLTPQVSLDEQWQELLDDAIVPVKKLIPHLAAASVELPESEYYSDDLSDIYFAELAWPEAAVPIAILAGTQEEFVGQWQGAGWQAITLKDIEERGEQWCIDQLPKQKGGE
ncbi:DEAD/DEAH box helicase [Marinobacter nauticus]|uniref:DEAD/DEAH box helicase domain-containing protein n=1 Tax=Marinobacter nauticus TaxID=2743 RepID=A0A368UME6_MARNT|nr:DEAD/DEAH box helicase [Marinobacter nauticus]RBP68629.1 DEAD/DEAH box helicase domain-containing protein [Marinobacter nauticus]RCW29987.1 DEAD/DEAH box helicase domain-containing protein [Marinobacter nauticus]